MKFRSKITKGHDIMTLHERFKLGPTVFWTIQKNGKKVWCKVNGKQTYLVKEKDLNSLGF